MKHLLEFQTVDEFTASKDSLDKPNISLVNENGNVYSLMGGGGYWQKNNLSQVWYGMSAMERMGTRRRDSQNCCILYTRW